MHAFVTFCKKRVATTLIALVAITALALWVASDLELDSDLERLLPESAPSVQGLEELDRVYGGQIGNLTVVFSGDDIDELRDTADATTEELDGVEGVRRVETKRPNAFFGDFRLLYADKPDLVEAKERIDKRIKWEKKRANPMYVDVSDEDPPEVDLSDLTEEYDELDKSTYYETEDKEHVAVFVYPDFSANELSRAEDFSERVRDQLDELVDERDGSVEFGLSGRYQKRVELQQVLRSDLALATSVALLLMIGFLWFFLRSLRGIVSVMIPLTVGTIWSFAWATLAFGSLNILTAFMGAILLGVGVDYGIHLYVRYQQLRPNASQSEALVGAFETTGRANFYGGLTTAIALGSLIVSDFQAFYEFGIIALGGIALILLAFATVLPSLIVLFERRNKPMREPAAAVWTRALLPKLERPDRRRGMWAAGLVGVIALVAIIGLPQIEFVRTLDALELRTASAWQLDEVVDDMIEGSDTPAVIPTDSAEHSAEVVEKLKERRDKHDGGYTVERIASLETTLPEEQDDKIELLTELRDDLADLPSDSRDEELEDYLDEIERVLEAAPLEPNGLPVSLREPFERKDDEGDIVLVFPSFTLGDTARITDFVSVLEDLPGVDADDRYDAISDEMLLYDIVRLVEKDAVWMLGITIIGLIMCSLIAFRSRRDTLLQLATLAVAFLAAVGLTSLAGVEFNFMNIVILPIWLGLGIDASFHILMHLRKHPHDRAAHLSTALAIAGAFLTSMIGFGAMLLADHQGLYSLGKIAAIGLGAILAVNLLIQLVLVEQIDTGEQARGAGDEDDDLEATR